MVNSRLVPRIIIVMLLAALTSCSGNNWAPFESGPVREARPAATKSPLEQGVMARTVDASGEEKPVTVMMSGGGEVGMHSMDGSDKAKMSKALDAATGKSTSWVNSRTNVTYTVTPIKKIVIEDNPFCREYQVTAEKGGSKKDTVGQACVMSDGTWHTI